MTDTRKWNYHCTGAQLAFLRLFFLLPVDAVVDAITCWHFFFNRNRRAWSKNENAEICRSSRDINISDLGGHVTLSGWWSLSQSLWNFFEISIVANTWISMLSVTVSVFKMHQTRFPPGHRPGLDPTTGAHDAPPDPLVGCGGGHVPLDSSLWMDGWIHHP